MTKDELTPEEIEALLGASGGGRLGAKQRDVLRAVHEKAAGRFAAAFSTALGAPVAVRFVGLREQTYGQFVVGQSRAGCCHVLDAPALGGQLVLDVALSILHPMIARLLGGDPRRPARTRRPATEIEQRLAMRIVTLLLAELRAAWAEVIEFAVEVARVATGPQRADIFPAGEPVVVAEFELTLDALRGPIGLCIPSRLIEAIGQRLAPAPSAEQIGRALERSTVELRVELARTRLAAGELLELGVGDVITTDQPVDEPLVIDVDGHARFAARPGTHEGRKAIQVEKRLEPS